MKSDFEEKLLATFKLEAQENLDGIGSGLIQLEQKGDPQAHASLIETMFRQAHSLKGAARSVGAMGVAGVCQALEEVFAKLKKQLLSSSPELLDTMHQAVQVLRRLISDSPKEPQDSGRIAGIDSRLREWAAGQAAPAPASKQAPGPVQEASLHAEATTLEKAALPDTIRIATSKLDSVLFQAEDLLSARLTASQRLAELQRVREQIEAWRREWARTSARMRPLRGWLATTRAPTHMPPRIGPREVSDFLEANGRLLQSLSSAVLRVIHETSRDYRTLSTTIETLLDTTKEALMLPFSQLTELLPVVVREISREQQKEVELSISGGEIEIDRRILEEIKDPFIHLLRNSIDHGIERPDQRRRLGKPQRGTIQLSITQTAPGQVEIIIADDGSGIDREAVKRAAISSGVRSAAEVEALAPHVLQLVFESGLSTAPALTELSGRGLGLAIVREKVEKLGGSISVESQSGQGVRFRILLPNTLARFRGVLIGAGGMFFMIPTLAVDRVARVAIGEIKRVENRETIQVEEQTIPLVRLAHLLEIPGRANGETSKASPRLAAVVLGAGERKVALLVDDIHFEQDVLMKSLGPQLACVRNVAGATVLGDGKVVPVLNAKELLSSALGAGTAALQPAETSAVKPPPSKTVLVAEDSFTSRSLLKHILQAGGFRVETAVDGADALSALKRGHFDLLVSDVDMPRLNGFDLTSAVRRDPDLAQLPVVLVTALASEQDRTRGIEAGANAYVIKSSFEQSNLLQVVGGLVH